MGEKGPDEFRGIGQHATKQAQEGDAAAPLIIGHAQQGTEEAIDDLRRLERLAVCFGLHGVEDAHSFVVEPIQAAAEHFLDQRLLGTEVIIHRGKIDPSLTGDLRIDVPS